MMNEPALVNALEQSVQWLSEGRSVSDCLRAYPDLADQLAPLLEVGIVVRQIQPSLSDIAAAQDRVRLRLQARQKRFIQRNVILRSGIAAVLVACFGILLIWQAPTVAVIFSRLQGTMTDAISQTPISIETVTTTATTLPSTSATPQQPFIQITRYTTLTASPSPTVPSRRTPTARPLSTSVPSPNATDDHGSGKGTKTSDDS